jgi:hypothetical protein
MWSRRGQLRRQFKMPPRQWFLGFLLIIATLPLRAAFPQYWLPVVVAQLAGCFLLIVAVVKMNKDRRKTVPPESTPPRN